MTSRPRQVSENKAFKDDLELLLNSIRVAWAVCGSDREDEEQSALLRINNNYVAGRPLAQEDVVYLGNGSARIMTLRSAIRVMAARAAPLIELHNASLRLAGKTPIPQNFPWIDAQGELQLPQAGTQDGSP